MAVTKARPHTHQMSVALLGNRIGCAVWHCDFSIPERPVPSVQGSQTSEAAARSLTGRSDKRTAVLQAIRDSRDGLTAEKIQELTGMDGNTVRPRIVELVRLNLIRASKRTRLTKSLRSATVYEAL